MTSDSKSPLVSFVVFGDTHITPEDDPRPTSHVRFALGRTRYLVSLVNQIAPDFAIHLGDVVAPLQGSEMYDKAVERAKELLRPLACPWYLVPGNHDLGDKPMVRTPAPYADSRSVATFETHWGDSYRSFSFRGCRFVLLNAPLLGTQTEAEERMRAWLRRELKASRGARTFVFLHYPIYISDPNEDSHYDNVDDPARSWLLELFEEFDVVAAFSGHAHNFFYNRSGTTDLYVLPAISHVRADFGDLLRADPVEEHGWGDYAKLGFIWVRVYEDRYDIEFVRTYGRTTLDGTAPRLTLEKRPERPAPFGVFMRHPWASVEEMACVFVDEMVRKEARNQWPTLALWDLGIERLRIPLNDFAKNESRAHARALASRGATFSPFITEFPTQKEQHILNECNDIIDSLELILPTATLATPGRNFDEIRGRVDVPIFLSMLETGEGIGRGIRIRSGWTEKDFDFLKRLCADRRILDSIDGLAFTIETNVNPWHGIRTTKAIAASLGLRARCHVSMQDPAGPGSPTETPLWAMGRVIETYLASLAHNDVEVYLDTLVSHDRGFRVYHGFVDRRGNPTLCYDVVRQLGSILPRTDGSFTLTPLVTSTGVQAFAAVTEETCLCIILPLSETSIWDVGILPWDVPRDMEAIVGQAGTWHFVDLTTGRQVACHCFSSDGPAGSGVQFSTGAPVEIAGPGVFVCSSPREGVKEVAS